MMRVLLHFPDGTSVVERIPADDFDAADKLPDYVNEHVRPWAIERWGADTEIRSVTVKGGPSWFAAA